MALQGFDSRYHLRSCGLQGITQQAQAANRFSSFEGFLETISASFGRLNIVKIKK